jgi:type II secretory pathway predicted ATPase ExeA
MGVSPDHSPEHPFADTIDPDVFYRSPMHETVCTELFAAGQAHPGLLVLSGEPGTGKTTVLRRVARRLEQAGGRVLWCGDILSLHETFGPVGGGPGAPGTATPAEALLAMMQARVQSEGATVVAVDEAQRLELGELGILCDLAAAGCRSGRPIAVLLVGLPGLDVKLASLAVNGAGRAPTFHARLSRLETPEVRAYMAYRLERGGLRLDRLFQAEAVERVATYAEGIPRVINHLCYGALYGVREAGLTMVSAPTVAAAAHWLDLLPPADAPVPSAGRGARRRLRLWAVRGALSGRRRIRAWSSGLGVAARGLTVPSAGRGARRRLRLWAVRGALSGRRRIRAWSSRLGIAARGLTVPSAGRGARRRLRLWAVRGALSGRRRIRAWSSRLGVAARGLTVPSAGRGARRRLRLWTARQALSGRWMIRAWSPGVGIAALGLGAIAVFLAPRPTSHPPSSPPQKAVPMQNRPAAPAPPVAVPGVPMPLKAEQVIERPPPPATPRQVERPLDTAPVPPPFAQGGTRGVTHPRVVSAAVALLQSAEAGNLTEVRDIIDAGVSPNARDTAGMTPLMMAAVHDHVPVVELLLTRGANINAQTRTGWTALICAAWNGHPIIVRRLLESGADPALHDRTGRTALQYATLRAADPANRSSGNAAELSAVDHRHYVEVIDVLSKASTRR